MSLPNQPSRQCDPAVFRSLFRLNTRLVLRTEKTMYLAVLHVPDTATGAKLCRHIQRNGYHGEVLCEMKPHVFYLQIFAPNEELAQVLLDDLTDELPQVSAHLSAVPKE